MSKNLQIRHQSIVSYVIKGTTIFNTILLLLHTFFGFFFHSCNATVMYYYNFLSIAVYILGYVILYKNISNVYITLVNAEVYIFMTLGTLYFGWDYGFQQYCIIFVVSLLFTDYCVNQNHTLRKSTILLTLFNIGTYLFLRLWTYYHPHMYVLQTQIPEHIFFIANSIIAFTFLIAYFYLYSQTVFRLEQALVDAATKDALTGLYNRRKMQDLLNALSEVLALPNQKMCIAMIDIDNFKKINDTYGHDSGDEVLRALADILHQKQMKEESFQACRWGGEEFLILYRKNHEHESDIIQEFDQIRQQIAQTTITHNDTEIHFTITAGIAFHKGNLTITETVKLADNNLYEGKHSGKNMIVYKE